jgi:hypothetical protein
MIDMLLGFVRGLVLKYNITFRELDLFPSSGETVVRHKDVFYATKFIFVDGNITFSVLGRYCSIFEQKPMYEVQNPLQPEVQRPKFVA